MCRKSKEILKDFGTPEISCAIFRVVHLSDFARTFDDGQKVKRTTLPQAKLNSCERAPFHQKLRLFIRC